MELTGGIDEILLARKTTTRIHTIYVYIYIHTYIYVGVFNGFCLFIFPKHQRQLPSFLLEYYFAYTICIGCSALLCNGIVAHSVMQILVREMRMYIYVYMYT